MGGVPKTLRMLVGLTLSLALAGFTPGDAAAAGPALSLKEIELSEASASSTKVVLRLDQEATGSAVSTFTLSDPLQIVVDIADAGAPPEVADLVDRTTLVERVSVETFDDETGQITRVRLFLSAEVTHRLQNLGSTLELTLTRVGASPAVASTSGDPLAAALGAVADSARSTSDDGGVSRTPDEARADATAADAPKLLSGPNQLPLEPALSSLDFQSLDDVSRVVIGLKDTKNFTASQPRSTLIVVDVPGAFVPQSLTRALDTTEFFSPVRMVRAYRTSAGARVAIDLRQAAEYSVRDAGSGLIYVDIPVPGNLRRERDSAEQSYSAVSPDSTQEGIRNAYQQEILIGKTGHTVDPQAAFGSGAGSSDPSSLVGAASGFGMDNTSATAVPYTGRRISLDLVNADIHSIFRLISHVSRLNIVAGDDVTGKVTVRMEDVPWDQAFAAILQAKSLGSQRFGNVVRVAPIETIKAEQQAALETKRTNDELEELQLLVLPLNYSQASELEQQVKSVLSKRGNVQVDTRGNQLIVQDTEDQLAQIRELVRHLDKQTPQVLIEARIVEATAAYSRSLGIQWGGELDASTNTGYSTGLFFPNSVGVSGGVNQDGDSIFYSAGQENLLVDLGASGSSGSLALALGSIPGLVNLDARLSAMESDGHGKVVSAPRVTTLDNQQASISQGQRIPYLSTSSQGTQVQFIQASLDLSVTPHITTDDKVFLNIEVKNNRPDFGNQIQGQPAIQIKEAKTQVLVADGDTTVVGGVFATEETWAQARVPGLSKIPILGYLFKNSSNTLSRNEMLVFITPHIVNRASTSGG